MKIKSLFLSAITGVVAFQMTFTGTFASDRIERTSLTVLYDQATDGNVRTEGLSFLRRACRHGLFGKNKESDAFKNNKWIDSLTISGQFEFGSTESSRAGNLDGDVYGGTVEVGTHFRMSVDVSFFYSHNSVDYNAFNDVVTGDAKTDIFGMRATKQMTDNCYLGASFFVGSTEVNSFDSGFVVSGVMDACRYGFTLGGGYTRQWGKAGFGENVFVDTSLNFGYQTFDVDQRNGGLTNSFDVTRMNFYWNNTVGTQFSEKLTAYAHLMGVFELDDCRTTTPLNFVGTLPTSDDVFFIIGGGFNYNLGGWDVGFDLSAKTGHSNSKEVLGAARATFRF